MSLSTANLNLKIEIFPQNYTRSKFLIFGRGNPKELMIDIKCVCALAFNTKKYYNRETIVALYYETH